MKTNNFLLIIIYIIRNWLACPSKKEKMMPEKSILSDGSTHEPMDEKYDVIVIDPPWPMDNVPHPTMTIEEIQQIIIPANENAVIFLWVINKYLAHALELLQEWGFEYKHTFVWGKMRSGHYTFEQVEFCLVGIKGKPIYYNSKYSDLISVPRAEHSEKPDTFYEMVRKICPGTRIDMFARKPHDGIDLWIIDVDKFRKDESDNDNIVPAV